MGLSFDPVGGGQFKQALKQIMEAEKKPLKALENRKNGEEARLKLFQEFKAKFGGIDKAIDEISSFTKLREFKVDLGDGTAMASVTVDKEKVQPGTYQIEVTELAARSSAISNGFENADEPVLGLGFIVMNLGNGGSEEIFVDEKESSLNGIAGLINSQANASIRAAVIRDAADPETPWRLIISAKKEGQENNIHFPEFYFMDGSKEFYLNSQHEAKNAVLKVDGFEVEKESNDIVDFLPGVNLHLKQPRPDSPFSLTITEDIQKIGGKVKGLIDQINGILSFITKQNAVDEKTDTKNTFAGDTGLQTIEFRLRNLLHEGFPAVEPEGEDIPLIFLNQAGIELDRNGTVTFKEDRFNKMMEKNFAGMAQAISGRLGFADQLREVIAGYTRMGSGMLAMREQGLRNRIKDIDRQIDDKTKRLEQREQQLTDQFARLESSLAGLQRQQQYLSASLPGAGGGGMVSQLLG